MNYRIIDYPHHVPASAYDNALEAMAEKLMLKGAVAVYQVGGVSNPGISDLDMVAVFRDEEVVDSNLLEGLSSEERYLFIHNIYGISKSNFDEALNYAHYFNYKFLTGQDLRPQNSNPNFTANSINQSTNTQVALEFLIKFYITLGIQRTYGVIRMRDILLHVKALQYDLEFLGIKNGTVYDGVIKVLEWRRAWFKKHPSHKEIIQWVDTFFSGLEVLLNDSLKKHSLFLPPQPEYRISKNIMLSPSVGNLSLEREGMLLPVQLSGFGKKYFRLQNRFNNFQLKVPVNTGSIPSILGKRFHFEKKIVEYNKKFLPNFLPITSSLHAV